MKLTQIKLSVEIAGGHEALVNNPQGELHSMLTKVRSWATSIRVSEPDGVDETYAELPLRDSNGNRAGSAGLVLTYED